MGSARIMSYILSFTCLGIAAFQSNGTPENIYWGWFFAGAVVFGLMGRVEFE